MYPASSMAHDAADDERGGRRERVYVNFGGFFEELVNQHRCAGPISAACATYPVQYFAS